MNSSALNRINRLGQSIWLDFIDRSILADGTLAHLIQDDDLAGLTSNPAIFGKAIAQDSAYTDAIARFGGAAGMDVEKLYTDLVLEDIAQAADLFLPVYQRTGARDGYVSIEVSPLLARNIDASVMQARALWTRLQRPNIMIKIPGTEEGLSAIRTLLSEGINVNVTLLFSVSRYVQVLDIYLQALEARHARGLPLSGIASVASFFLSRIDTRVDALLDQREAGVKPLRGRTAIACAALAYRHFRTVTQGLRWQTLAAAGAGVQRLLWASTGTKDPAYSDIKYVEPLIAMDTVNTLPRETLDAYRDHGDPALRIEQSMVDADQVVDQLAAAGIDLPSVMASLEEEGIVKFIEPYQATLKTLERLRQAV